MRGHSAYLPAPLAVLAAILTLAAVLAAPAQAPAQTQLRALEAAEGEGAADLIPEDLTPETVDGLLARLTDAEIRAILRDELARRAEEAAGVEAAEDMTLVAIRTRLTAMAEEIGERLPRWGRYMLDISDRFPLVAERIAEASHGFLGMLAAAAAVAVAGFGAAFLVSRAAAGWRAWLMAARGGYWDRVIRTFALGLLELAPVAVFVFVTLSVVPALSAPLGRLVDYAWIYEVGVSYGWWAIVTSRRAFAPDAPALRIAHLSDAAAVRLHTLIRRAVQIGAGGWLIAGLSPTLGLGFPPALLTVAFAGTAVAALLLTQAVTHRDAIRDVVAEIVGLRRAPAAMPDTASADAAPGRVDATAPDPDPSTPAPASATQDASAFARIATASAPWALIAYLAGAYLYWLAHWLERGQQRLDGPAGTLVMGLFLPILDRLGAECIASLIPARSDAAGRYRAVLRGAWRMLLGIVFVFVVAGLWGLDLFALAKGPEAPMWASTLFDIAVTLLLARIAWQLILAALWTDEVVLAGEDSEVESSAASSRLQTLVPLFRTMLLAVLVIVVTMIVLSSLGVDIGPLLASAGVLGIAIGFGAQTLVRDIFSGVFFLLDDAFRVGEYIELEDNIRGDVAAISIRSLQIRNHRGPVITIPFGEVKMVKNHVRDWVIYKMSFRLEPETDPQKVKKIVKRIGAEFMEHPVHGPKFIEPLKSQGVYMIDDDSALVIRVKFKCKPRAQFVLRRELYHRIRQVFAEEGIEFARRKVEVVAGEDDRDAPPSLSTAAAQQVAEAEADGRPGGAT